MISRIFQILVFAAVVCACRQTAAVSSVGNGCAYAMFFELPQDGSVVTVSPYSGKRDTLELTDPVTDVVCLSSTYVACLSAVEADSVVCGVSGLKYLNEDFLAGNTSVADVGYDSFLDFELILSLDPDLVVAYVIGSSEPPYIGKLRSLGVPLLLLYDYMEQHPLARAEYVRLFGALTGRRAQADEYFAEVCHRYDSLRVDVHAAEVESGTKKVLMNALYGDVWYIPGADNYISRLVRDAGGEVLGAMPGCSESRAVGMEEAFGLSQEADLWLCPGASRSLEELKAAHRMYSLFGPVAKGYPVYNNNLLVNDAGGNDFYQTGAVRPDLILEDLIGIISGCPGSFHFFQPLL